MLGRLKGKILVSWRKKENSVFSMFLVENIVLVTNKESMQSYEGMKTVSAR